MRGFDKSFCSDVGAMSTDDRNDAVSSQSVWRLIASADN